MADIERIRDLIERKYRRAKANRRDAETEENVYMKAALIELAENEEFNAECLTDYLRMLESNNPWQE